MGSHGCKYPKELYEQIATLYKSGISLGQIGKQFGLTRSTIGGIIRRTRSCYQIPYMGSTAPRAKPGYEAPTYKQPSAPPPPPPSPPSPTILGPIGQFPPTGTCQYTEDEITSALQFRFCGQPGFPWCPYHAEKIGVHHSETYIKARDHQALVFSPR